MSRKFFLIIMVGLVALLLTGASLIFFGQRWAVSQLLDWWIPSSRVEIQESEGNIARGIVFRNIHFQNLVNMPPGAELKIQELVISHFGWDWKAAEVEIHNARLILPNQDPVVLNGQYHDRELDFNIFTNGTFLSTLVSFWPDWDIPLPDPVSMEAIDLYVRGTIDEPNITGLFVVRRAIFQKFELIGAPVELDLTLNQKRGGSIRGVVEINQGHLYSPYADLRLTASRLIFEGDWANPRLNLNARANIARVRIALTVQGEAQNPDLKLSSEPPLPKEELMLMLATGQRWKGLNTLVEKGEVGPELTKDFFGYFFLAGRGGQFARRYGLHDFSILMEKNRQGLAARKSLSEWLDVGYAVEKETEADSYRSRVKQKVEGALQVTDKVSVGVERKVQMDFDDRQSQNPAQVEDTLFLQFKTHF